MLDDARSPRLRITVLAVALLAPSLGFASPPRLAHVFVALCDNVHQGIVPVPAALGDGDDPARNLYWGARYGLRGFFDRAPGWRRLAVVEPAAGPVLQRAVYRHEASRLLLVADAYRGSEIAAALSAFLDAAAGRSKETVQVATKEGALELALGTAELLAYVGHDGLMDQGNPAVAALKRSLPEQAPGARSRPVLVIACDSRAFFAEPLRRAGATPLLWTTGLLAAEAYTLEAAVAAWASDEPPSRIRERAAAAYASHQRCGLAGARRLFATGW